MKELDSAGFGLLVSSTEGSYPAITKGILFSDGSGYIDYKDRDHAVRAVYEIK